MSADRAQSEKENTFGAMSTRWPTIAPQILNSSENISPITDGLDSIENYANAKNY